MIEPARPVNCSPVGRISRRRNPPHPRQEVLAERQVTLSLIRLLADNFRSRSEVDLDLLMFVRSAITTVAEVLLVVDLAQARQHRWPDGQIASFAQNPVHPPAQKYSA